MLPIVGPLMLLNFMSAHPQTPPQTIRLWPGDAPLAHGKADADVPSLAYFPPKGDPKGPLPAMVICPGGGYGMLADHEGSGYALFLNRHGMACFVLKYRLGSNGYRHPAMLLDAARALRTVRARAKDFNVDPKRIGIMGSSAGGHLAATLLTHFDLPESRAREPKDAIDDASSRPDFGVLCYAVISMGIQTHGGSKQNLLGDKPSEELVKDLSNELQVKPNTPPCFIWHTVEDPGVPVENSILFASALREKHIPFELHLPEKGTHGLGLGGPPDSDNLLPWTRDLVLWLVAHGWASH